MLYESWCLSLLECFNGPARRSVFWSETRGRRYTLNIKHIQVSATGLMKFRIGIPFIFVPTVARSSEPDGVTTDNHKAVWKAIL